MRETYGKLDPSLVEGIREAALSGNDPDAPVDFYGECIKAGLSVDDAERISMWLDERLMRSLGAW